MTNKELEEKIERLEKRIKQLEDYNEQQRQARIAELQAENDMLNAQLKMKGMLTYEEFLNKNKQGGK